MQKHVSRDAFTASLMHGGVIQRSFWSVTRASMNPNNSLYSGRAGVCFLAWHISRLINILKESCLFFAILNNVGIFPNKIVRGDAHGERDTRMSCSCEIYRFNLIYILSRRKFDTIGNRLFQNPLINMFNLLTCFPNVLKHHWLDVTGAQ